MKNLNVVLGVLLVAMVGFSSCSKSDDDKKKGAGVTGTWGVTSFTYDGYFSVGDVYTPVTGEGTNLSKVRITFNSDGTTSGNGESFVFVLMSKEDPSEKLSLTQEFFERGGTWKKEGGKLLVNDFFGESVNQMTIAELTGSAMHLTASFEAEPGSNKTSTVDLKLVRKD